ncbi:hypothetical protein COS64_03925 [archaeon CG06_land_8_20_14_3_00_37_11]|nr:MAG: hypothetical protein COS64_03925 [archaeon CG06_land_8_20_14_3_00_37_11]
MINNLSAKFEKDFGAAPIIPDNHVILGKSLFEISRELKNMEFRFKPLAEGLLLARGANPCARLLELNKTKLRNVIVLNEKSAFLFTCSRKVMKKGIVKKKGNGPVYAAMNEKGEILGIIEYRDNIYSNKVNIGYYFEENKMDEVIF